MERRFHSFFKEGLSILHDSLANLFFPPVCALCSEARPAADSFLCHDCRDALKPVTFPFCSRCGLPIPGLGVSPADLCGRCLIDPPLPARIRYGVRYEGTLRMGLIRFKYYGALHTAPALAQIVIDTFQTHFQPQDFDMIVPVPVHRTRLIRRGFNQSVILGQRVSAATGVPLKRTVLRKTKDTPPQVGLPRADRLKNIRGSFGVSRPHLVTDRRILLIDDVATTGATIREAAKVLMKAGARRVDALVLALRLDSGIDVGQSSEHATAEGHLNFKAQ